MLLLASSQLWKGVCLELEQTSKKKCTVSELTPMKSFLEHQRMFPDKIAIVHTGPALPTKQFEGR